MANLKRRDSISDILSNLVDSSTEIDNVNETIAVDHRDSVATTSTGRSRKNDHYKRARSLENNSLTRRESVHDNVVVDEGVITQYLEICNDNVRVSIKLSSNQAFNFLFVFLCV